MRTAGMIALACSFAACDAQYGLYVTVDVPEVRIDRVALHFGTHAGDAIPQGYAVKPLAGLQQLYNHDDVDDVVAASGASKVTYYVPSDAAPADTSYVLAIGYLGDTPVAIGELMHLELPADDEVFQYKITLEPFPADQVVIWGAGSRCMSWTHMRSFGFSSVAIVPADDSECVVAKAGGSCDALLQCGDNCPFMPCVTAACELGECKLETSGPDVHTLCAPSVCLDPAWCQASCNGLTPELAGNDVAPFLACSSAMRNSTEYRLVHDTSRYCTTSVRFELPVGLSCTNPRIVFPPASPVTIEANPNDPGSCIINLPTTGLLAPADEHIVIALDPSSAPTTSLTVGLHLGTPLNQCDSTLPMISNPATSFPVCSF